MRWQCLPGIPSVPRGSPWDTSSWGVWSPAVGRSRAPSLGWSWSCWRPPAPGWGRPAEWSLWCAQHMGPQDSLSDGQMKGSWPFSWEWGPFSSWVSLLVLWWCSVRHTYIKAMSKAAGIWTTSLTKFTIFWYIGQEGLRKTPYKVAS